VDFAVFGLQWPGPRSGVLRGTLSHSYSAMNLPADPLPDAAGADVDADADADMETCRAAIAAQPGLSDFRRRTLLLLTQVPRGRFTTYQALASALGKPNAARAVGGAVRGAILGAPCHRVVGSDRRVGGDARTKTTRLRAEGVQLDEAGKVVGEMFTEFS
jgi:methylated-DNA-[protein]-cysteine S-methyltransferase